MSTGGTRWPLFKYHLKSRVVPLAAVAAGAAALLAALQIGASAWAAIGLALLFGVSAALFAQDRTKDWGDFGEALMVSAMVGIAILAVQRGADDRAKRLEVERNKREQRNELARQKSDDRQALQLALGQQADLSGVALSGRDLRGFFLRDKKLAGADLRGAVLDQADLSGSDLHEALAARAKLNRARTRTG
jgi:uncharacterized protein YjbI with pentapeptide repeats